MNQNLNQAMLPIASFHFDNSGRGDRKVCLIPGHFDVAQVLEYHDSVEDADKFVLSYTNYTPIVNAGYFCEQVADDWDANVGSRSDVQITPNTARVRFRDFLSYIKLLRLRVSKIRITNTTSASGRSQFLKEMEVSASAIGSRAGSDYINLAQYKNPANFDQDVIEIDLDQRQLLLDATTLVFLNVAASAQFDLEFTLAPGE